MSWLSGWSYRKEVTLSRASGAVTNYQMRLVLGESFGSTGNNVHCRGLCASDFDDIRFTKADGTTLLDYWIESLSGTTPNQLATIWIEFDSIGTTDTTFYMYYGNAAAPAVSNGVNTFLFFEDFNALNDGDLNGQNGWTANAAFDVQTAVKYEGAKALQVYNVSTGDAQKDFTTDSYELMFNAMMKSGGDGHNLMFYPREGANAISGISLYANKAYHLKSGGWEDTNAVATNGTWWKISLGFDSRFTHQVWINDTLLSPASNSNSSNISTKVDSFTLQQYNASTAECVYDLLWVQKYLPTGPAWGTWGPQEYLTVGTMEGWTYRKKATISRASGEVSNYQMKILVGESSGATGEAVDCGGLCLSSFNDLRFTTGNGTTLLDYWIESISGASPNQLATIWVEFDLIEVGATPFYMYYGKADAAAVSNGANTFLFFDDFDADITGWSAFLGSIGSLSNPSATLLVTPASPTAGGAVGADETARESAAVSAVWKVSSFSYLFHALTGRHVSSNSEGDFYCVYFDATTVHLRTRYGNGTAWETVGTYAKVHSVDTYYGYTLCFNGTTIQVKDESGTVLINATNSRLSSAGRCGVVAAYFFNNPAGTGTYNHFAVSQFLAVEPAFGSWLDVEESAIPVNLGYAQLAIKAWGIASGEIVPVNLGVATLILNAFEIASSRPHASMGDPRAIGRKPRINVSAGRPGFTLAPSKKPRATISMEGD